MEFERTSILTLLCDYDENLQIYGTLLTQKELEKEKETIRRFLDFIKTSNNHFSRDNSFGHFTGSAWVLSPFERKIVLTHHKKLEKQSALQPN